MANMMFADMPLQNHLDSIKKQAGYEIQKLTHKIANNSKITANVEAMFIKTLKSYRKGLTDTDKV